MKLIALVGAVGVGKTYWGRQIEGRIPNCQFIQEDTSENLYLNEFYQDMKKWGFHSRISMLSMILANFNKISPKSDYVIIDRCVQELIVFATKEFEEGNMTEKEFRLYRQLFDSICSVIKTPDIYVYFHCSNQTSYNRILQRGRECEKNVTLEFCTDVMNRYNHWYKHTIANKHNALVVDTDQPVELDALCRSILESI